MKKSILAIAAVLGLTVLTGCNQKNNKSEENDMKQELQLTQEWDKVFPLSDKVNHQKVTFKNHFGITLAADVYTPKAADDKKLPAIAVGGPFGAVKEQVSGLYAMRMAERGYVAVAADPSFMWNCFKLLQVTETQVKTRCFQN